MKFFKRLTNKAKWKYFKLEIWSLSQNKMVFLPNCGCVSTMVWINYLDSNAILKKFWEHHSTKEQVYGHLPPISQTIQLRWTRHIRYCGRNWDGLISDVPFWTPTYGHTRVGWLAKTYIHQFCGDTVFSVRESGNSMISAQL